MVTSWFRISTGVSGPSCHNDLRVAVGNDTIEADLVEVRSLELQHLVDTGTVDGVGGLFDLLGSALSTTEAGLDELLAVLVEKVKGWLVSTSGDLDQLCKSIADLGNWQSAQETEVEEGVNRCVVSTETVLVVAVVDGDLDGHRGVNETNNGGRDTDEVGVPSVRSTSETIERSVRLYEYGNNTAWEFSARARVP